MGAELREHNGVIADSVEIRRYESTVALVINLKPEDMAGLDLTQPVRVLAMFEGSRAANRIRKHIGRAADHAATIEAQRRQDGS